ncbi:two-component response regulator ORR25-like [Phragmites australis]|uniref:two-component response regulator ORR25-like n=1 Tax=Phragmites australis TaxID=29695 RepID=UPI002D791524|nr:two-component response regulator ORR25-like [Phragmites australis]
MDVDKFRAGLRVLAVDDDSVSLKLIEKQLRHCNYDVTTAMHAEAALEMLRARKDADQFDLVISDVHMPGMDGFKLLELIGLEMDIPVIMLSANDDMETMMKGIKHGACNYLVKPVHIEQLRNLWMHVVRKSKTDPRNCINSGDDDAGQKSQSADAEGQKDGASHTRKNSRKKKKDGDDAEEDKGNTSTQKRQRIRWSAQLHRKFVEVIDQIGVDRAIPKKIVEMMNVDGLSRENVASHLQKYRLYLKKLSVDKFRRSNPFADEPEWNKGNPINMNGLESFKHNLEHGRYQPSLSFAGSWNSSNPFARMNSPSVFGTHSLLPTKSVQLMSTQRNLCIPRNDMGSINHGGSLLKDGVPGSQQNARKFILSGNSYANVSNGALSSASELFPSRSSFANSPNSMAFNRSKSFPSGASGNSFANISNDSPPLVTGMGFPCSRSGKSYASILRGKMLAASRGIPFDADNSFTNVADGEMLAPSSHFPVQSPDMANQPSVQMQSSYAEIFRQFVREDPRFAGLSSSSNTWKTAAPSKFPDLCHKDGTSGGPSQGNSLKINQFSRLAASSSQMATFGNEFQNQTAELMRRETTPMVGFNEQVAPFNLGSNANSTAMTNDNSAPGSASSIISSLPNLQIDNSVMPTQMLNGGGASGNLSEQAFCDKLNNINESLMGTSEAQNGMSGDLDDFFSDWLNQDYFKNGDAFMDGDREFAP